MQSTLCFKFTNCGVFACLTTETFILDFMVQEVLPGL